MKLTKRKAWCVAPCQRFANFNAWVVPFPKGGVIVSKRLIQFKKIGDTQVGRRLFFDTHEDASVRILKLQKTLKKPRFHEIGSITAIAFFSDF